MKSACGTRSRLPAVLCRSALSWSWSSAQSGWGARRRPTRKGKRYSSPDVIPVIPPGEDTSYIPAEVRLQEEADGNNLKWLVAIEFTDAEGRRWLRDPRGRFSPAG